MKYKAVYMKLRQLRAIAEYVDPSSGNNIELPLDIDEKSGNVIERDVRPSAWVRTWFKTTGLADTLAKFSFNVDTFANELFIRYGEFYLPVCSNTLLSVAPALKGDFSVSENAVIKGATNFLTLNLKMAAIQANGKSVNKETEYESVYFSHALIKPVSKAYIYADVYKFLGKVVNILNRATSKAEQLLTAYNAIPTSGEQFTDETVTTPNLETENVNTFDPIKSAGYGMGDRYKVTQKGTQTTTVKRAANISAREQVEIVRNLPNIFTDCMDEIGDLLVDPRAVQDMYDWGLAGDCWIDD